MKKQILSIFTIIALTCSLAYGQKTEPESSSGKCFVGSSAFILANAIPNQTSPPHFFQLNFGYWLSKKDVISLEAITWRYGAPLGIPYGSSFESPDEAYPGYVREFGIGLAYQRFLWKNFYSAIHAVPFKQKYTDLENNKIQNGFQLFMTLRFGYHIRLFQDRFFLEPSIAFTHWPINTNVPDSFRQLENKWPNYFLFEPGLHFGYKF